MGIIIQFIIQFSAANPQSNIIIQLQMAAEITTVEMVGLDSKEDLQESESDLDFDESSKESCTKDRDYEEENDEQRSRLLVNRHRL